MDGERAPDVVTQRRRDGTRRQSDSRTAVARTVPSLQNIHHRRRGLVVRSPMHAGRGESVVTEPLLHYRGADNTEHRCPLHAATARVLGSCTL